jgi:hypothetical protein
MKPPTAGKVAERCLSHIVRNPPGTESTNNQADRPDHGNGKLRARLTGLMFIAQDKDIASVLLADGIAQCSQLARV